MFNNNYIATNNNNNSQRGNNVTTKIRSLYGESGVLTLSYWADKFSIKINPMTGVNSEGVRQYDYVNKATTALTADKCIALRDKIKDSILPALKKANEDISSLQSAISYSLIMTSGMSLTVGIKKEDDNLAHAYLSLVNSGNQNGGNSVSYTYRFGKTIIIRDMDASGNGQKEIIDSEFEFFYEKLSGLINTLGDAAHSINYEKSTAVNSQGGLGGYSSGYQKAPTSGGTGSANSYSAPVGNFTPGDLPF